MTREEAEQNIARRWQSIYADDADGPRLLEPSLTEEYEWGWVITLVLVRNGVCQPRFRHHRYACERSSGRSYPVGTKGLASALKQLGVGDEVDWKALSPAERTAHWERLERFTCDPLPYRPWDDPADSLIRTVAEIVSGERPVLLAVNAAGFGGGLGGWQFFDGQPLGQRYLVGLSKTALLSLDPTLAEITDLSNDWVATRTAVGQPWQREPAG